MEEQINKLIDCIEKEIEAYKNILELSQSQKEALLNNGEEMLSSIAESQNSLIEEIKEQENIRRRICKGIAIKNNLALNQDTFKEVILIIEEKYGSIISFRVQEIKMLMHKISEINNNNVFLIEQGKKNIKAFYSLVSNANDAKLYYNNGKLGSKNNNIILLDKRL